MTISFYYCERELLKECTLLYAEDELAIQKQYVTYFSNYFKNVLIANDGQETLELYNTQKPEVLLLDIKMPKMNGLDVVKKIRLHDKNIKIILLTALGDKKTLKEAVELGLVAYLEKPVTREELKDALNKLVKSLNHNNLRALWYEDDDYWIWNEKKEKLVYKKEQIRLTKKETLLLKLFIKNIETKVTYQDIYEAVWDDNFTKEFSESTIKTLLSNLRAKLPKDSIKNVYGMGYSLNI